MYFTKTIVVPLIFVLFLDFYFTLVGQPEGYWKGNYNEALEMCPIAKTLLLMGPAYFILAYIVYAIGLCIIVGKLHKLCSRLLFLDVAILIGGIMGHTWGASTWLPNIFKLSFNITLGDDSMWYLMFGYYTFIALLCGVCFSRSSKKERPS